MSERASQPRTIVCNEIKEIMQTYREQEASRGGVDTPGGLEHMGDVWGLLRRWDTLITEAEKASSQESPETGWLIAKTIDGRPHWLTCAWSYDWTSDADNAIRFCRRIDAEQIGSVFETDDDVRIEEHQWG